MKTPYLFLALLIVLSASCQKDDYRPQTVEEKKTKSSGIVTAMLNGRRWGSTVCNATYGNWKKGTFDLFAEHYQNESDREHLSISNINYNVSRNDVYSLTHNYNLYKDSCRSFLDLASSDASLAHYELFHDSAHDNYITVDEYDPATHHVKGRFQLNYYLPERYTKINFGDTLRFTHGSFDVYLGGYKL